MVWVFKMMFILFFGIVMIVPILCAKNIKNWVVVSNIVYFHPYLGKISNLTNIFQMGWIHRLEKYSFKTSQMWNVHKVEIFEIIPQGGDFPRIQEKPPT